MYTPTDMEMAEALAFAEDLPTREGFEKKEEVKPTETVKEKMEKIRADLKAKREEEKKNAGLVKVSIGENFVSESEDGKYKLNWKDGRDYKIPGPYGYTRVSIANIEDTQVMEFTVREEEDIKILDHIVRVFGFCLVEPA